MEKIFVLGAGTMGSGIVQAFAQKGYEVIVRDIKDELVQSGIVRINNGLSKLVSKGKMTEETKEDILSRISGTTDMNLAADCDLVVEAAIENMKIKKEIFAELDKICKPETILASNTSSLSITEVAFRRAAFAASASFATTAASTFLIAVFTPDLIALLRSILVLFTRILFFADLMLANPYTSKYFQSFCLFCFPSSMDFDTETDSPVEHTSIV